MCEDRRARMIIKSGAGKATVPATSDHRDGTWLATDVYPGEWYLDTDTGITYTRNGSDIVFVGGGTTNIQKQLVVDITTPEIENIGSLPVELLPALGAGKYYEYTYIVEKSGGSTVAGTVDFYFIGTGTSFIGNLFDSLTFQNAIDGFISGSSRTNEVSNGLLNYTTINGLNENIVFTTYNLDDPTSSLSTFRVIITYIERTFGA